ncbi:MAG: hypothetical protein Q7T49_02280 [bacterium]|nr:hypothetical protein [bacterium]
MTHGEKESGPNPSLTPVAKVKMGSVTLPQGITNVVVGTGTRFLETYQELKCQLLGVPVKFSPLCGSADNGEKSETGVTVFLADGTPVNLSDYLVLIITAGVDLKVWINSLQDQTLLVVGREFLGAIGYKNAQSGHLYQYDGGNVEEVP